MVTWPVSAEQFYNENLVTQILFVGARVPVQKRAAVVGDSVKKEATEKAVTRIMEGKEAEEMRSWARKLGEMATRAVEEAAKRIAFFNRNMESSKAFTALMSMEVKIPQSMPHGHLHK
ncbi:unnamed protein product [Dovyalis caffra]|uniref:Uncharacterized protein n=1 Tax=Dovyalis caffra TaxID=77055 RepID=A0AAV1SC28_9ROSI|nr:unnamed protein product [Dovyalis caffra]